MGSIAFFYFYLGIVKAGTHGLLGCVKRVSAILTNFILYALRILKFNVTIREI